MKLFKSLVLVFIITLVPALSHAEFFSSSYYGWMLDLPEGFKVTEAAKDGLSYYLEHSFMKVRVAIQMYSMEKYKENNLAMEDVLNKLNADGEIDSFLWRNRPAAIATYKFRLSENLPSQAGWGIALTLPEKEMHMVVLCYADSDVADDCQQFISSCLDSVALDKKDLRLPGILTSYAYDSDKKEEIQITLDGKKIFTSIPQNAKEAGRFVIDREFSVLTLYAKQKEWKEAWQRYYRLIFRQAYSTLDCAAESICKALYCKAASQNPETTSLEICRKLLNWVQDFSYARKQDKSDFNDLTSVLQNQGSDCDSRSLLLCVLMEHYGVKTELFVSGVYSHAVFGVNLPYKGARIEVDGVNYLLCETTAPVDMGLIAQEQRDTKNWIGVDLP